MNSITRRGLLGALVTLPLVTPSMASAFIKPESVIPTLDNKGYLTVSVDELYELATMLQTILVFEEAKKQSITDIEEVASVKPTNFGVCVAMAARKKQSEALRHGKALRMTVPSRFRRFDAKTGKIVYFYNGQYAISEVAAQVIEMRGSDIGKVSKDRTGTLQGCIVRIRPED